MQKRSWWDRIPGWLVLIVAVIGGLAIILMLWQPHGQPLKNSLLLVSAAVIVGLAAWGVGALLRSTRQNMRLQEGLDRVRAESDITRQCLESLQRVDAEFRAAITETQVMQAALSAAAELAGARGASLVPLDEWGQALPAYTVGSAIPARLISTWNEHLSSSSVRAACRACQKLAVEPGEEQPNAACPLASGLMAETASIYCLPVQHGARLIGMVNLYAPDKLPLSEGLRHSLATMMNQAAVYVEMARIKERETAVLQQGQTLRSPGTDLSGLLNALLEGLQQALGADGARLTVRGLPEEWLPPLELAHGDSRLLDDAGVEILARDALAAGEITMKRLSTEGQLAAAPMLLPDGRAIGVILLAGTPGFMEDARARAVLRSAAGQAALLIDNERELLSLEYRTIIQERARLAREIHDGLAQTLAFLKLQAAQMQIHLAQGSLTKLGQALKQNYETLSDAYLDTRQAIDNLRLTPQQGLTDWLGILLDDLQVNTGMVVERAFSPLTRELPPEAQIQVVRILQEALNNVRKHADASAVRVLLREWNGDLVIEVTDDGRGFQAEEVPGLSQYGLRGMRERAELIGADFQIVSVLQHGTTIRLSIPLQSQETMR